MTNIISINYHYVVITSSVPILKRLEKNENLRIPSYNPTSLHPKKTEIKEKEISTGFTTIKAKRKKLQTFSFQPINIS
jgi:hypothetical protein